MRAIYCLRAVYNRYPLQKRYKRTSLIALAMVGESEKYHLPAYTAKLRLTLHQMPWAFKFGIGAGTTGTTCDIHFG